MNVRITIHDKKTERQKDSQLGLGENKLSWSSLQERDLIYWRKKGEKLGHVEGLVRRRNRGNDLIMKHLICMIMISTVTYYFKTAPRTMTYPTLNVILDVYGPECSEYKPYDTQAIEFISSPNLHISVMTEWG